MHLQPRPKSASNIQSSSALRGLYSPYGFLPEKVQGEQANGNNKQFVKLLGDPQKTQPQQTYRGSQGPQSQPLRPQSGSASSRALVPSGFGTGNNSAATSMMRIDSLEMKLISTREELNIEHEAVADLEETVDSLRHEISDLKEQLKSKSWAMVERQRNLKEAEYKNEMMAEEGEAIIEDLRNECAASQNEIKELRDMISSWEGRWEEAETTMDQSEEQIMQASSKSQKLEILCKEVSEKLTTTELLLEEKNTENGGLRKRNSELENQIVALSKIARMDEADQASHQRMSCLLEQVSEELNLSRLAREQASTQALVNKERQGGDRVRQGDDLDEADWASLGGHRNSSAIDIGEAIGDSLARRLPEQIADQLRDSLTRSVAGAVKQQLHSSKKDKHRTVSGRSSRDRDGSMSVGTNEGSGLDTPINSTRSTSRRSLSGLDRLDVREEVMGNDGEVRGETTGAGREGGREKCISRGASEEDEDGAGDGASTFVSGGNQVPDEDTQLSMRGVESYRGSKGGDDGDGFTLADGLTLNDGMTIGDGFGEADNQDQTVDTNIAASESFDRRLYTNSSVGSPGISHEHAHVDFEEQGRGGVGGRRRQQHHTSCRSVESGLSVNSSTLPQTTDVYFDDGGSATSSNYNTTNYYGAD